MCALVRHNVFLAVSPCHKNLENTALAERECEACPVGYWWTLLIDASHQKKKKVKLTSFSSKNQLKCIV